MEFVYVVPRGKLFPDCYPHGFVPFGSGDSVAEFEDRIRADGYYVERDHAERAPELKQVIPYCVVVVDGDVLLLRRLRRGGEARLHDKLSIGVGGHVNPEDSRRTEEEEESALRSNPIPNALARELGEELSIQGTYEARCVGIINDDSNPVGAVHVGSVQVVTVDGSVEIREKDVLEGELVSPGRLRELHAEGANFETWSALLVDHLDEILQGARVPVS